MEPHATTASWDTDGLLTLYETTQHIFGTKELVSIVLGVPPEKINVVCHFLGGGFGCKGYTWPHTLMAALSAKVLNRPVRVQLTRAQMYSMVGHQPASSQTISLGAAKNGKLTGIRHDLRFLAVEFEGANLTAFNCRREQQWALSDVPRHEGKSRCRNPDECKIKQ